MFSVFRTINRFAGKSKLLDVFAIFCARGLLYLMLLALLVFAYVTKDWRIFFYPLLSGLFAVLVVCSIINFFYKEHRPSELEGTKTLIPVPHSWSFPSRHASVTFGMSFYLLFWGGAQLFPLAIIFLICSCFVGIARVFCGVHWFHDILGGALAGLLSSVAVYTFIINF